MLWQLSDWSRGRPAKSSIELRKILDGLLPPVHLSFLVFERSGIWSHRPGERQKDREPCAWRCARAKISIPTTQRTIDDADSGIQLGHTRHLEAPLVDHRRCSICSLETRLCRSRKWWKERISEEVRCYFPFAPPQRGEHARSFQLILQTGSQIPMKNVN